MTIDPEKLMAYADGELDAEARAEVERALASDQQLRAELEAQQALRARLAAYYGPVAAEEVPDRLRAMLGAPSAGGSVPDVASLAGARARREHLRFPAWQSLTAVAATFVAGLLAGHLLIPSAGGPLALEQGTLVAQGPLARALETQLASAQPTDADTRIGITFADGDGRACRTFEAERFAGLACRQDGAWAVVMTTATPDRRGGEYRQASSPAVMAAAQELMAGAPLDAEAERAARDADWTIPAGPAPRAD